MSKRTPLKTTERVARKAGRPKQVTLYRKVSTLNLTGEPSEMQRLMSDVHHFIGSHELVKGGKGKRRVSVTHSSTTPEKIFDGIV